MRRRRRRRPPHACARVLARAAGRHTRIASRAPADGMERDVPRHAVSPPDAWARLRHDAPCSVAQPTVIHSRASSSASSNICTRASAKASLRSTRCASTKSRDASSRTFHAGASWIARSFAEGSSYAAHGGSASSRMLRSRSGRKARSAGGRSSSRTVKSPPSISSTTRMRSALRWLARGVRGSVRSMPEGTIACACWRRSSCACRRKRGACSYGWSTGSSTTCGSVASSKRDHDAIG